MIRLIVAVDEKGGISRHGHIPWDAPEDRKHFRLLTTGGVVVMGRANYEESVRRPLPARRNIVISRQSGLKIPGCEVYSDLKTALAQAEDIWVIGGASIYEQTLPLADEVYMTKIPGDYHCDRFFPSLENFTGKVHNFTVKNGVIASIA